MFPANPQGWVVANQRSDSTVAITGNQPRAGNASLEFETNFATAGQDKVDYQLTWLPTDYPNRLLNNLQNLEFEYYRDSAGSAVAGHLHPALRLYWVNDNNGTITHGVLVYEEIYQGINPVPQDNWDTNVINLNTANFWMYCSDCGGGTSGFVQNFTTTLQTWKTAVVTGQTGDPTPPNLSQGTTYIAGINTGVGSGWGGNVKMWVDQIRIGFGAQDDTLYNFELNAAGATATAVPSLNFYGLMLLVIGLLGVRKRIR